MITGIPTKEQAIDLYNAGQLQAALKVCASLSLRTPGDSEVWCLMSAINGDIGQFLEAETCSRKAISLSPGYALARFNLALACLYQDREAEACEELEKVVVFEPGNVNAFLMLARGYGRQGGRLTDAISCYEKARLLINELPQDALIALADLYERSGEPGKALVTLSQTDTGNPQAEVIRAKIEKSEGKLEAAQSRLENILQNESITDNDRLRVQSIRSLVLDRQGRYPEAFEATRDAQNIAAMNAAGKYNTGVWYDHLYRCKAVTTIEKVSQWKPFSIEDRETSLAFLVGFPRSGTTLVEKIISASSKTNTSDEALLIGDLTARSQKLTGTSSAYPYNLGELDTRQIRILRREYWKLVEQRCKVAPRRKLFLDKYPFNIIELCFIKRIFPEARIVLMLRDPRDVCLSCYMQMFMVSHAMANFYTLEGTARAYAATMDLLLHYEQVLELQIHRLRYEDLVLEQERNIRELVAFLGIDWDDRMLEFHRYGSHRYSTPSYQDVTQPLFAHAAGRWVNYSKQLQPVLPLLEPYVEAFGYQQVQS